MNVELFEQVTEYLDLPDLLTLALQNEECYQLVHDPVFQRNYLKQRTEFIPDQVAPWIGYFDDFPDDNLEYEIYDLVRQFIRASCYYLSKTDLEQLFKDNEALFLFVIEYGDIPNQVIAALKLFNSEDLVEEIMNIAPTVLESTIGIIGSVGNIAGYSLSRYMTERKIRANPERYKKITDTLRRNVHNGISVDSVGFINQALKIRPQPSVVGADIYPEVNPQWTHIFRTCDVLGNDLAEEYDESFDWERNQLGDLLVSAIFSSLLRSHNMFHDAFATDKNITRFENFLINRKIHVHGNTIRSILGSKDDHMLEYFREYPYLTAEAREVLKEMELAYDI